MNLQVGQSRESAQIESLPDRGIAVTRQGVHERRELSDSLHGAPWQQFTAQRSQVQPLKRRPLESSVMEVESIDVDVGPRHKARKPP